MPVVRVQPGGFVLDVKEGETIMEGARAAGYYWPTTCGGRGECTTCACKVLAGAENLSPMGRAERNSLIEGRGGVPPAVRLACQVSVYGEVEVERRGVLPPSAPSENAATP